MELVCSPVLSFEDIEAIRESFYDYRLRKNSFASVFQQGKSRRGPKILSWLLSQGQLAIRIALVREGSPRAIYHEKIGLLLSGNTDPHNRSTLAFEGSANESSFAYISNFERLVLHRGRQQGTASPAEWIEKDFERIWENQTPGISVLSLHEAFKQKVLQKRTAEGEFLQSTRGNSRTTVSISVPTEILQKPSRLQLSSTFANSGGHSQAFE